MKILVKLSFHCGDPGSPVTNYESLYVLTNNKEKTRENLINTLLNNTIGEKIIVPNILPKFITVQQNKILIRYFQDSDGLYNFKIVKKCLFLTPKIEQAKLNGQLYYKKRRRRLVPGGKLQTTVMTNFTKIYYAIFLQVIVITVLLFMFSIIRHFQLLCVFLDNMGKTNSNI